jgi:hypothetical protein
MTPGEGHEKRWTSTGARIRKNGFPAPKLMDRAERKELKVK